MPAQHPRFSRPLVCLAMAFVGGWVTIASQADAEMVSLTPLADAFVSSANPTNNYGGAGALAVASSGLPKGAFETYLKFDFLAARDQFNVLFGAGNWNVSSAQLVFTITTASPSNTLFNPSSANTNITVTWLENDAWDEGTGTSNFPSSTGINWNSRSSFNSPNNAFLGASSSNSFALALQPAFVNEIVSGQVSSMRMEANDLTTAVLFNSSSFGTVANRPSLTITALAVPEPNAFALVVCSMASALMLGRRRPIRIQRC